MDIPQLPAGWLGQLFSVLIGGGGGIMWARRKVSSDRVAMAADVADIRAIVRLQKQLDEEAQGRKDAEARADGFAKELQEKAIEIGQLRGRIEALAMRMEYLTDEVKRLRTQQETK